MAHRNAAKSRAAAAENGRAMSSASSTAVLRAIAALTTRHFAAAPEAVAAVLQVASQILASRTLFLARFAVGPLASAMQRALVIEQVHTRDGGQHLPLGQGYPLLQTYSATIYATAAPLVIAAAHAPGDGMTTAPEIGSFIGVPVFAQDGSVAGVLGGIDAQPLDTGDHFEQLAALQILAQFVSAHGESDARQTPPGATVAAERDVALIQLQTVFDSMTDGVYIYDVAGHIQHMNQAGRELLGVDREPVHADRSQAERSQRYGIRDIHGKVLPPEQWPVTRLLRGERLSGNTAAEFVVDTLDGRTVELSFGGAPILGSDGAIIGAVSVCRDVTERRRLERAALTQAQELEAILTAVSDGLFVFDAAGHLIRMNPAGQAMLGVASTQQQVAGEVDERAELWALRDINHATIPTEQWPLTRILGGEQLAGERAMDIWMRSIDGHERLISTSGAPMMRADGSISGAVTLTRDVTVRRQLEQQTQQALAALLRMAQASVKTGGDIYAAARELALVTCEVLGCRRVGVMAIEAETCYLRPLAVVGLTPAEEADWWAMQPADTRYDAGADPAQLARFEAGEAIVLDMTEPPLDQLPNPFAVTTALYLPMRLDGRMVGMLSLDHAGVRHHYSAQELALAHGVADLASLMVEREQLLVAHTGAQARELALQQANVHMHTFLGIAGHELRTPITSIKANIQLAERSVRQVLNSDVTSEVATRLTRVDGLLAGADRQIERLNRLIGDLLDVTRIEAGKLDLLLAPSDLAAVVREAIVAQSLLWPQRDITLTVADDVPGSMLFDAHRIEQVVTNYLTNALKYTPADSPVTVVVTRQDGDARVAVTDQGPGIPLASQGQLWDLFHQVEGITQQNGSSVGLGLGLYICQTLIARHGGQVGVVSTVGQGATFWFTLPIASASHS